MSIDLSQLRTLQEDDDETRPTGEWADAPAIAASTVEMVNTSGYPLVVDITAGTVTVIKTNGVIYKSANSNVTSGRVRVRRGGTLAITYSVVPTSVHWYYE